jgi:hypothetical protein
MVTILLLRVVSAFLCCWFADRGGFFYQRPFWLLLSTRSRGYLKSESVVLSVFVESQTSSLGAAQFVSEKGPLGWRLLVKSSGTLFVLALFVSPYLCLVYVCVFVFILSSLSSLSLFLVFIAWLSLRWRERRVQPWLAGTCVRSLLAIWEGHFEGTCFARFGGAPLLALEIIALLHSQFSESYFARTLWVCDLLRVSLDWLEPHWHIGVISSHDLLFYDFGESLSTGERVSFLSWSFVLQSSFSGGAFLRAYTGFHTKRWLKTCLFLLLVILNRWLEKFFNWVILVLLWVSRIIARGNICSSFSRPLPVWNLSCYLGLFLLASIWLPALVMESAFRLPSGFLIFHSNASIFNERVLVFPFFCICEITHVRFGLVYIFAATYYWLSERRLRICTRNGENVTLNSCFF